MSSILARWFQSSEEPSEVERALRAEVMEYFRDNPDAMDTADGIAEWWLRGKEHVDRPLLEAVLQRLTEEGRLRAAQSGLKTRFSLRRRGSE